MPRLIHPPSPPQPVILRRSKGGHYRRFGQEHRVVSIDTIGIEYVRILLSGVARPAKPLREAARYGPEDLIELRAEEALLLAEEIFTAVARLRAPGLPQKFKATRTLIEGVATERGLSVELFVRKCAIAVAQAHIKSGPEPRTVPITVPGKRKITRPIGVSPMLAEQAGLERSTLPARRVTRFDAPLPPEVLEPPPGPPRKIGRSHDRKKKS